MKVSLNLAQYYSNVDLKAIPREELLGRIGAQLGAVEDVKDWRATYEGVVVVKVITCDRHPDTDKLSLCLIDDGGVAELVERNDKGYAQVVCGAPNVEAGMFAAWIPPGVSVPSTRSHEEPFVLEARELRGKVSNGMLASEKELDISDNHEGILEIHPTEVGREPTPGDSLVDYFWLDDFVVDCENKMFTHRPDCFGNLGVARELAGIHNLAFEGPKWYLRKPTFEVANRLELKVSNEILDLVPRFTIVAMDNVTVDSSPVWMRATLKRVGIKSVNNIVDITNYLMHITGQPLHAFDYDKLQKLSRQPSLQPRMAKKGEKLRLLNDSEIELSEEDIVIATDKTAVALAGVMGGADTEVDETTKRIVIECANFDMYSIRRSSMRHGLFTDAVTRFNKGQSPLQNDRVISQVMKSLQEQASALQASQVFDIASFDVNADNLNNVETSVEFINERLGSSLSAEQIKTLLENVEFRVMVQDTTLHITVPFWRMDISIAEDIVEEVGRLFGYNKLPVTLPTRPAKPARINQEVEFKQEIRRKLSQSGANEVLTYSFVHSDLLEKVGIDAAEWSYHLRNALSPDLQYYRPSLLPSLLSKVHGNLKAQAGQDDNVFALFEIGKAHIKGHNEDEEDLPKQMQRLALVVAADNKTAKQFPEDAYYQAKKYLSAVAGEELHFMPLEDFRYPLTAPYQKGKSAVVTVGEDNIPLGVAGELRAEVRRALKLPRYSAGLEVDIDLLMQHKTARAYKPLSSFPSSQQDVTFDVPKTVNWGTLYDFILTELRIAHAESGYESNVQPLSIYQPEGVDESRRVSFRISLTHQERTLNTEEVNKLIAQLSDAVKDTLHASRI